MAKFRATVTFEYDINSEEEAKDQYEQAELDSVAFMESFFPVGGLVQQYERLKITLALVQDAKE